jgi:hypothetical protein
MFGWLKKVRSYLHRDAVAVDDAANVFTGGNLDETISSRAQRAADRGTELGKVISGGLDVIQPNHGHLAEGGDLQRAETVAAIEEKAPGMVPEDEQK